MLFFFFKLFLSGFFLALDVVVVDTFHGTENNNERSAINHRILLCNG